MGKNKPKCVLILTEGPSDRAALTDFFVEMYSMIDSDIEVFFPILREETLTDDGDIEVDYNGDITSRRGVTPINIYQMILKNIIHPELKKHSAYEYPSSVCEVIHLVDIDGVYLDDDHIVNADIDEKRSLPYYDDENHKIIVKDREKIIQRNKSKRENLEKLIETKRLRITMDKDDNESREKPYRVFFFSSNLDHVLFNKANNESLSKVPDARKFGNDFYGEPLKMASYFLNHPGASSENNYKDSWNALIDNDSELLARTNINILVKDLLKRAKIDVEDLPQNDIRQY